MDANTEFYKDLKTNFVDTIKQSASSDDVIKFIIKSVNEHAQTPFAKMVVQTLSYGKPSRDVFIKRVFDYVCHAVDYLRDPYGREIIFTPKLLINRGKGDCKKQSLLIATILKAAGIEPTLKVISYGGKDWEHIFVTVKGENGQTITLDPVNDKRYNEEIKHSHSREYYLDGTKSNIMANKLESMGGTDDGDMMKNYIGKPANTMLKNMDNAFNGMGKGKLKEMFKNAGDKLKKVVKVAEKVGFAPARGAFLGLIKLGEALEKTPLKIHLADKLAQQWAKDPTSLKTFWSDFGGKPEELGKVILDGHKTTIGMVENHIGIKAHEFEAFDKIEDVWESPFRHKPAMRGDYIGQAAAVAGAITAAMPIIIKVKEILVKSGLIDAKTANSIDGVMDSVLKKHNDKGIPDVDEKGNEIITAGSANDTGTGSANKSGGGKQGCFLTTACCQHFGLADDCFELTTLREFRDGYMKENYPAHIDTYYKIAPVIVEKIQADSDKDNILTDLFEKIKIAVNCVTTKHYDVAQALYTEEIIKLKKRYNLN